MMVPSFWRPNVEYYIVRAITCGMQGTEFQLEGSAQGVEVEGKERLGHGFSLDAGMSS